jgi:hypothetical protein
MTDFGNLDPMGVDESATIDRIETNRRIAELEVTLAATRIQYEQARDLCHDLGMTLRRTQHGPHYETGRQVVTMLKCYDSWKVTGVHPHAVLP